MISGVSALSIGHPAKPTRCPAVKQGVAEAKVQTTG